MVIVFVSRKSKTVFSSSDHCWDHNHTLRTSLPSKLFPYIDINSLTIVTGKGSSCAFWLPICQHKEVSLTWLSTQHRKLIISWELHHKSHCSWKSSRQVARPYLGSSPTWQELLSCLQVHTPFFLLWVICHWSLGQQNFNVSLWKVSKRRDRNTWRQISSYSK